jgi:predicted component of type VI protein secretion system
MLQHPLHLQVLTDLTKKISDNIKKSAEQRKITLHFDKYVRRMRAKALTL